MLKMLENKIGRYKYLLIRYILEAMEIWYYIFYQNYLEKPTKWKVKPVRFMTNIQNVRQIKFKRCMFSCVEFQISYRANMVIFSNVFSSANFVKTEVYGTAQKILKANRFQRVFCLDYSGKSSDFLKCEAFPVCISRHVDYLKTEIHLFFSCVCVCVYVCVCIC